jgi:hypothetical protein
MKRVAAIQSSYVPWRGYFDVMGLVDEFILLDEVQFTKRDWRNRNRIKAPNGPTWLTIPVQTKGRYEQRIDEVEIADPSWADRHWQTVRQAYAGAPAAEEIAPIVGSAYERAAGMSRLSDVNRLFLETLAPLAGVDAALTWSTDYTSVGTKTERLVSLCAEAGAGEYVSGPAARDYLEEAEFAAAGIAVRWMDYDGYREYPQQFGAFEPNLSILDLLFNTGRAAPEYMHHAAATAVDRDG